MRTWRTDPQCQKEALQCLYTDRQRLQAMVCALHASETALDASKRADIRSELIQQDRRMLAHCLTINEPWEG